ncbi:MaoC/PaaZ C-terminal domain-containing protein [Granulicoccus phenolivorans]|uniref:MaoC/PaaZ C-terminal domain-containing protein n=1 Tax=Granulicoccus phenolivorans TaxID=266854 RepID=UPI00040A0818|nr:MaoC/PaaZ C-terminal domain-containing protein [Granulicoccus phenolivorans]
MQWPVLGAQVRPGAAQVGDTISSGRRASGPAEWNRYAAVNDEFVPIHMDDAAGRAAGYPGAIGMGRLQWSYVHVFLREWLAGAGRIRELSLQYRRPALKDAEFEVVATVTRATSGEGLSANSRSTCAWWTPPGRCWRPALPCCPCGPRLSDRRDPGPMVRSCHHRAGIGPRSRFRGDWWQDRDATAA